MSLPGLSAHFFLSLNSILLSSGTIVHLLKDKGTTPQRLNPSVYCGLWLITMYPYWLIDCNKCATLMQDVNKWETVRGAGRRGRRERSVLSARFFCKTKIALKKKIKSINIQKRVLFLFKMRKCPNEALSQREA